MGNKAGGPAPPVSATSAAPGAPVQPIPIRNQEVAPTSQWNKWRTAGSQASIGTTFDTKLSAEQQANKPRMTFVQAIMTALAHSRANLYELDANGTYKKDWQGDKIPIDWKKANVKQRAEYFRNALEIIKGIPNLEDLPIVNVYSVVTAAIGTTNKQDSMQNFVLGKNGKDAEGKKIVLDRQAQRAIDLKIAIDTILGYSDEYLANYGFMTNVAEGVSLLRTLAGRQFTGKAPVAPAQIEMQQVPQTAEGSEPLLAQAGQGQGQGQMVGGRKRSRSKQSKPKKSRKYAKRPSNHTRRR